MSNPDLPADPDDAPASTRRVDPHPTSDPAVVIIGAGPAGLTAAYQLCKADVVPTVLESDKVVGGISRTARADGWRFDIGGHRFFTKVQPVEDLWHEILSDDTAPLIAGGLLAFAPAQGHAAGMECPEVGAYGTSRSSWQRTSIQSEFDVGQCRSRQRDRLLDLQAADRKARHFIRRIDEVPDRILLLGTGTHSAADGGRKWHRMRQFDATVQQQIAANTPTPGTLIIANVPLPPAVFGLLRSQAASASQQSPAQFMAAILARAAGN